MISSEGYFHKTGLYLQCWSEVDPAEGILCWLDDAELVMLLTHYVRYPTFYSSAYIDALGVPF